MEEWLNSVKLIKQINDEIVKQGNKAMRTHDMTMTQLDALIEIDTFPDRHCSLKNLEQRLHLAQPTVVGIISRLEQKGYVETFGDPDDKRVKLVCITDEGTACAEISKQARKEAVIRLLSCLTVEERNILYVLLKKVHDSL